MCALPCGLHSCLGLREHHPGVVKEDTARGGELDALGAADEKRRTDLVLEIANLATE